jgi:hypothetical protein
MVFSSCHAAGPAGGDESIMLFPIGQYTSTARDLQAVAFVPLPSARRRIERGLRKRALLEQVGEPDPLDTPMLGAGQEKGAPRPIWTSRVNLGFIGIRSVIESCGG